MARFRYRAVATDGAVTEDVIEAPDRDTAIAHLRRARRLPVDVRLADDAVETGSKRRFAFDLGLFGSKEPARGGRVRFTRELETLIAADVGVDRALEVLSQTTNDRVLAPIVATMRRRIREGQTLAEAMAAHPVAFSRFYCAVVRAGEAGGHLAEALESLAQYQERMDRIATTVQSALIYPALLMGASLISLVILLVYVVPQFEQLFRESAAELPASTAAVIAVSRFVTGYGWLVLAALLAVWFLLRVQWRRGALGLPAERFLLELPLVGPVVRRVETERFARVLGALMRNGVALTEALDLTADAAKNSAFARLARRAIDQVKSGTTLATALAGGVLPPIAVELIRVGEEGGRLTEMLDRLAASHAAEAEIAIKRFVSILEPALIVGIGIAVGAITLSLVSAIVGINALAF